MMWSRLLSWLEHTSRAARGRRRPLIRSRHSRLRVEILEDRTLLSTVTTLADDGSPDSLRGAIAATPAGGTVDFAPGLTGTIRLVNSLERGTLTLTKNLTIAGPANAAVAVSGDNAVEVFSVTAGNAVTLRNLTVRDGAAGTGGGIRNEGTLTLDHVTLTANVALLGGAGAFNAGTLTVVNSTVAGNSAGTGAQGGGGIANAANATLSLVNATVAGNTAGHGGGLLLDAGSRSVTLGNTVVANNTAADGPDIKGAVTAATFSLLRDPAGSTGFTGNGDLVNMDPRLGPLQNNGGPTFTEALMAGSPAVNAGSNALAQGDTDQRGFRRVVGTTVDMGAFEYQPPETTIAVTTSGTPSVFGQPVTFTATVAAVAPGSNTPTGMVNFIVDGGTPSAGTLDSSGRATLQTSALAVGPHTVAVQYLGDFNFARNNNGSLAGGQQVNRADTRTSVASSLPTGSVFGQPVTFTATVTAVAPGAGTPGGTVNFVIDGGAPQARTLDASGRATLQVSNLTVGSHTVRADYVQNDSFNASSDTLNGGQAVNRADTTTAVTSSMNPSVFGQPVTFTATVMAMMPGAGTPGGTVNFVIDGSTQQSRPLDGSGRATLQLDSLTVGTHTVAANYVQSASFNASSGTLAGGQRIQTGTVTAVTTSGTPSVFGQSVTFTATVTAASGTPTGTVNFVVDGGMPQTRPLDGTGHATLQVSTLSVGPHTVRADYMPTGDFAASSGALNGGQQVNRANTTTAVTTSGSPSVFGQQVTFTAAVTAVSPGAGTPDGMVNFVIDGGAPQARTLDSNGRATLQVSNLTVGPHTVRVDYVQGASFNASSGTLNGGQQVNRADTATAVTSSMNPSVFGQSVTFTATVTAVMPGAGTPGGTVNFVIDGGAPQARTLDATGHATFQTSTLAVGPHTVRADYAQSDSFNASSGTLAGGQTVQTGTMTAVTTSGSPSVFGQPVTFTATVTAAGGTPTGTVNFVIDGGAAVSRTLDASGHATYQPPTLAAGNHTVVANYVPTGNFAASSGTLAGGQQVNRADTTTTVTTSGSPSVFGQPVTFTAQVQAVAPGAGTPDGTVNFVIDGGMPQARTLDGSGRATLQLSTLSVGPHTVVANYVQSANFNGSSGTLNGGQAVNRANTTTTVTSSANPSAFGQQVTFTATVAPVSPGAGVPGGTVNFVIDGGAPQARPLDASGRATLQLSSLAVGPHTVRADYLQGDSFNASSGTLNGGQQVNTATTTTTVTSSLNPATVGQPITFTATVASNGGTPTGSVNFVIDNGTPVQRPLDAAGRATLQRSDLTLGSHTVRVDYVVDAGFAASSGTLTPNQQVNADTTTTVVFTPAAPTFGQDITFTATVSSTAGTPTGSVNFVIDGGAPASRPLDGGGRATFDVANLTAGPHTVRVDYVPTGNFNPSTATLAGGVTVAKAASQTVLTGTPNPLVVGQPAVLTATVSAVGTTPLPPGGTVTFFDNGTQLGNPVTLGGGVATFTTGPLTPGAHQFTATYGGDANFNPSTGTLPNGIVTQVGTTLALTSTLNPARAGQNVTFTVVVTPSAPSSFTPSGTVTFFDNGTQLGNPVTLGANNTATFITSTLAVGPHAITARYSGDTNFGASSTAAALNQVVRSGGIFAVGGGNGRVQVRRTSDGSLVTDFVPFPGYSGPVSVAVGDVNGDGFEDVAVAAAAGSAHVKVFDGKAIVQGTFNASNPDANALASFFAYGTQYGVGTTIAIGYVNGTVDADLITGASAGNPHVKVYSGASIANGTFGANPDANVSASFFAYAQGQNLGVNVACGDVTHAGFADVVTAPTRGNPDVKVYSGQAIARQIFGGNPEGNLRSEFMAFGTQFGVGAFVAVGDTTGFGFGDLIVGASAGNPQVKIYSGRAVANGSFNGASPDASLLDQFFAYDSATYHGGATVGAADFEGTGRFDLLTGTTAGAPHFRVVSGTATGTLPPAVKGIEDIPGGLQGGVSVGAA